MLVTIVRLGLLVTVGASPSRRLRAGVSSVTVAAKLRVAGAQTQEMTF
jgi:hypothetical protein